MNDEGCVAPAKTIDADFCVIGGGLAGVCAALAAARNGASVVLVQDRSVLGGNASSEIRMHIVGADCHGKRPGARESGIIEELRLEDATNNPQRSYSMWDLLLYRKIRENSRITLLLETACTGCTVFDCHIEEVHAIRTVTEERFVIRARMFADCSGDGRLGMEAGAEFIIGRESREEHGESLAVEARDQLTLGNTILFTARKHDAPQTFTSPDWVRNFQSQDFKFRNIYGYDYGFWWLEWGGHLDTIKDLDIIRHELYRISLGIWDYIKNSGDHPEAKNYALDWVSSIPGKRESRRFFGPHVLSETDVRSGRMFDDQVAYGGWWIDLHPPLGMDATDEEPAAQHDVPFLYGIPLKSLYSRNISNLFFAGRNISATHVAFASTRVMGTCAVMGQAIGTSAAILMRSNQDYQVKISDAASPTLVREIQQTLLRDDVFIPGIQNEDSLDLARGAFCQASSEHSEKGAANIISGVSRRTEKDWGSWSNPAPHCWESLEMPATVRLQWSSPQTIGLIELTFCSALERELLLTLSEPLNKKIIRGPQPEIVRDYDLIIDDRCILEVRGNFQRKRRHMLSTKHIGRHLQINVLATNGLELARIYEVRVYAEENI